MMILLIDHNYYHHPHRHPQRCIVNRPRSIQNYNSINWLLSIIILTSLFLPKIDCNRHNQNAKESLGKYFDNFLATNIAQSNRSISITSSQSIGSNQYRFDYAAENLDTKKPIATRNLIDHQTENLNHHHFQHHHHHHHTQQQQQPHRNDVNHLDEIETSNPHLEINVIDDEQRGIAFIGETVFLQQKKHPHPSAQHHQSNEEIKQNSSDVKSSSRPKYDDIRHFALGRSSGSIRLRATYGPFWSEKTIESEQLDLIEQSNRANDESKSIDYFDDTVDDENLNLELKDQLKSAKYESFNEDHSHFSKIDEGIPKKINAYLVTKEVSRSHPILRVLFYTSHLQELRSDFISSLSSSSFSPSSSTFNDRNDKSICAIAIVQFNGKRLFGTCSPSNQRLKACLAEIVIPASYWQPLDVTNEAFTAAKQQKSTQAKLYQTLVRLDSVQQCEDPKFLMLLEAKLPDLIEFDQNAKSKNRKNKSSSPNEFQKFMNNLSFLSDVALVPFRGSYEEVTNDNVVTVLIPQEPVYPNSKIYIPVKYTYNPEYPLTKFSISVRVKPGLKICGAQLSHSNQLWQISTELGLDQTSATVTAFLKQSNLDRSGNENDDEDLALISEEFFENISEEIYVLCLEITESIKIGEINGRIVWEFRYETINTVETQNLINESDKKSFLVTKTAAKDDNGEGIGRKKSTKIAATIQRLSNESFKLTSLIDIQKDVIQDLIAITDSNNLLNTAVLNGRQVSRSLRIYQVTIGGKINDITFQCSCQSLDETVLKVSSSCSSIYLDGSELRGSQNATILIRYGSMIGQGNFIVWMPSLPLEVVVSDTKLSQIKGWRVHRLVRRISSSHHHSHNKQKDHLVGLGDEMMLADDPHPHSLHGHHLNHHNQNHYQSQSSPLFHQKTCQLKFQQARVEVYTKFLSNDPDSGREASLINKRASVRITNLVKQFLRVSDRKILRNRGNIIEGLAFGKAQVEIISPITGAVIGSKQIEVNQDRESIVEMQIRLISGIEINVEPSRSVPFYPWTSSKSNPMNRLKDTLIDFWSVKTRFTDKLTKQYQEALLDIKLIFSDQKVTFLSEISSNDYHLMIETYGGVVDNLTRDHHYQHVYGDHIVRSSIDSNLFINEQPRIIALQPGRGELIHIALDSVEICRKKTTQPLAESSVNVTVEFELPEIYQNDANNYRKVIGGKKSLRSNETDSADFVNKILNSFSTMNNHHLDHNRHPSNNFDMKIRSHPKDLDHHHQHHHNHGAIFGHNNEFSIQLGLLCLISIIFIACIIILVYSLLTRSSSSSSSSLDVQQTIIGVRRNRKLVENREEDLEGESSLLESDPLKQFRTKFDFSKSPKSESSARDWIWISKEELEQNHCDPKKRGRSKEKSSRNLNNRDCDRNNRIDMNIFVNEMSDENLARRLFNIKPTTSQSELESSLNEESNKCDRIRDYQFDKLHNNQKHRVKHLPIPKKRIESTPKGSNEKIKIKPNESPPCSSQRADNRFLSHNTNNIINQSETNVVESAPSRLCRPQSTSSSPTPPPIPPHLNAPRRKSNENLQQ